MFDHVIFTGTINLGAISTAIITILGLYIVYWRGKLRDQKTRRIFREESAKTRTCLHSIPGHPEYGIPGQMCDAGEPGPAGPAGPVISTKAK